MNCLVNVNLGAAGVAGATYFLSCHIYAREEVHNVYSCPWPHDAGKRRIGRAECVAAQ